MSPRLLFTFFTLSPLHPVTSSPVPQYRPENPLIVQGDHTVLVEVGSQRYDDARDALVAFAELVKSPEHVHTYRLTPLSIWNATAAGVHADAIVAALVEYAKYPVPEHVLAHTRDLAAHFGRLRIEQSNGSLGLIATDAPLAEEISRAKEVAPLIAERLSPTEFRVDPAARGPLKQALIRAGWPAEDLAGYTAGEPLPLELRPMDAEGRAFALRHYQREAAAAFHASGSERGGSGVVVLPCGAGKTIVGMAAMAEIGASTLI